MYFQEVISYEHAGKISLRLLLHLYTTKEILVTNYLQIYYWSFLTA